MEVAPIAAETPKKIAVTKTVIVNVRAGRAFFASPEFRWLFE
jgi:hypothetical protein